MYIGYAFGMLGVGVGLWKGSPAAIASGASLVAAMALATNAWGIRSRIPVLNSSRRGVAAAGWAVLAGVALLTIVTLAQDTRVSSAVRPIAARPSAGARPAGDYGFVFPPLPASADPGEDGTGAAPSERGTAAAATPPTTSPRAPTPTAVPAAVDTAPRPAAPTGSVPPPGAAPSPSSPAPATTPVPTVLRTPAPTTAPTPVRTVAPTPVPTIVRTPSPTLPPLP